MLVLWPNCQKFKPEKFFSRIEIAPKLLRMGIALSFHKLQTMKVLVTKGNI